ncbi:MAG: GerMN domain-containing protein [Candidatus Paceibacterota bacterium]|jgi:spore germination protein GerM
MKKTKKILCISIFLIGIIALIGIINFQTKKLEETKKVQIFFNNTNFDPEISCNKVFPVIRNVEDKPAIATMAIEELLKGLTEDEERQGYTNSIPVNVKLNKINITDGTAFVDFNEELEKGVGGSCRVSSIRAQITETLKQFSIIQNVTISINGRTEDILQP